MQKFETLEGAIAALIAEIGFSHELYVAELIAQDAHLAETKRLEAEERRPLSWYVGREFPLVTGHHRIRHAAAALAALLDPK